VYVVTASSASRVGQRCEGKGGWPTAEGLARKPARALAAIRRCVTEGVDLPFDEGLAIEREEVVALGATADFREGLDAFLGRRPPAWSD
jgi:enoyl-CoA hydratase/carnithine racemase